MTTSESVIRWPESGQFWAWKNPLCLLRVDDVGVEDNGDPGVLNCTRWTPLTEDNISFVSFGRGDAEFLWWSRKIDIPEHVGVEYQKFLPGDVLNVESKLVFIGPETAKKQLHVLASWPAWQIVTTGDWWQLVEAVYQRGPGHRKPLGKTAYDHLLEDK
jgi:hypothetical protein